jgi:oligoribonuclease NrnB/cAMP/cGMP phosphodiesterase (DHH superfamily)
MKDIVIYHDNCPDGFGAALAANLLFEDNCDYLPMSYDKRPNLKTFEGVDVYILDFGFDKNFTQQIIERANKFVWLDHHKTAQETALDLFGKTKFKKGKVFVNIDTEHCGAILAWNHFIKGNIPKLFELIDDYDRWVFKHPDTKAVNKGLWLEQPWNFRQWLPWLQSYRPLLQSGEILLKDHNRKVDKIIDTNAMPCKIHHAKGFIANCPNYMVSDVGHELAKVSKTFGLTWSMNDERMIVCSLRSIGDYDVTNIAKLYGGGGHKNAAGFQTTLNELATWLI